MYYFLFCDFLQKTPPAVVNLSQEITHRGPTAIARGHDGTINTRNEVMVRRNERSASVHRQWYNLA